MWSSLIGNHQKINRVARQKLGDILDLTHFPTVDLLELFEGSRGPDGLKVKSPGENESSAFYDPFDPFDTSLIDEMLLHYGNLTESLANKDCIRASFDASWMSHVLVDGLTPAHHYPYEEEIGRLRDAYDGETKSTTMKRKDKVSVKGNTPLDTARNNWKIWGIKGLLLTHTTFEGGVAAIAAPLRYKHISLTEDHISHVREIGVEEYFKQTARRIALLNLYEQFYSSGWTFSLAQKVRKQLLPEMITAVATMWFMAMHEAGLQNGAIRASR